MAPTTQQKTKTARLPSSTTEDTDAGALALERDFDAIAEQSTEQIFTVDSSVCIVGAVATSDGQQIITRY